MFEAIGIRISWPLYKNVYHMYCSLPIYSRVTQNWNRDSLDHNGQMCTTLIPAISWTSSQHRDLRTLSIASTTKRSRRSNCWQFQNDWRRCPTSHWQSRHRLHPWIGSSTVGSVQTVPTRHRNVRTSATMRCLSAHTYTISTRQVETRTKDGMDAHGCHCKEDIRSATDVSTCKWKSEAMPCPIDWRGWPPPVLQAGQWFSFRILRDVRHEPRMAWLDNPKKLGVEDYGIMSWPVSSHLTKRNATSDDPLDVPEPAVGNVLSADDKNAEKMDLDVADVIALFKKINYKGKLCSGITSSMLRPTVRVFDTGAVPNLGGRLFLPVRWRDSPRPIHNLILKSATSNLIHIIGRVMLIVQMGDVRVRVHSGVVE